MQFGAYGSSSAFDLSRPDALFQDLHVELMTQPSRDAAALRAFLRLKPSPLVWRHARNACSFVLPSPVVMRSRILRRFACRYLVQTYRFALMSDASSAQRLGNLWNQLCEAQRISDPPERIPLRFLSPPSDYNRWSPQFVGELTELVIARQVLPRGDARERAHLRVIRYLKQTRVLPDRGDKPSVPQAENFVKRLGTEASSWLAVVEAGLNAPVSGKAAGSLAAWGCTGARGTAWRLALPFLSQRELRYLLKNPSTREFRMIHLIHARLRGILKQTVVADHLFGAEFVRDFISRLRSNPLVP